MSTTDDRADVRRRTDCGNGPECTCPGHRVLRLTRIEVAATLLGGLWGNATLNIEYGPALRMADLLITRADE